MSKVVRRIIMVGFLSAGAFVAVSGINLKWMPAPAIVHSVALSGTASGSVFESEIIEADATLAALSWRGSPPEAVWVRTSESGSEWSEWISLGIHPEHAPDPGTAEARATKPATDAAYFGPVSFLQFRILDTSGDFTASAVGRFSAEIVETSGRGLSLRDRVIRLYSSVELGVGSQAEGVPGRPVIIQNEAWGGPQCIANLHPRKLPKIHRAEFAIVHHTASNNYTSGQGALDAIYAMCVNHVSTKGWWDIGYNFLIDRDGNIYEGRRGSLEEQIRGGHTAGFNAYSFGVAMMGDFEQGIPTQASIDALEELLAWRMDLHHLPASGVVTVESLGSSLWLAGTDVEFDRISGHLDATKTVCPGAYCYNLLPDIRTNVAAAGEPKFSVDFSNFDPVVPDTIGYLVIQAPAGAPWTVSATQRLGSTVWRVSGDGPRTVSWDAPVAPGPYTITVDFGVLGVHEQVIQVGSYEWPFVDDEGSYARSEINDMWNRGITLGCDWDRFCPGGTLTRAEIATFVARAMDGEVRYPSYQGDYSDVAAGEWYTGPIEFLVNERVLPGGGGVYGVTDPSTRAFVVQMILAAIGDTNYPTYQGYFTDVLEGAWYTPTIERAFELDIARGYPDGSFRPENTLTREEATAFLMRGLG